MTALEAYFLPCCFANQSYLVKAIHPKALVVGGKVVTNVPVKSTTRKSESERKCDDLQSDRWPQCSR
jgi:hypothetical protein